LARERRLSSGAQALHSKLAAMGASLRPQLPAQASSIVAEKDVQVVAESKEWGEEEDNDSDGDDNTEAQRCRRASDAHMARERRLSSSAQALHLQLAALQASKVAGEREVQVMAESKEWGEVKDDDSDGNDNAEVQRCRRASDAHIARERRLSSGAQALHMQLGALQASQVAGERDIHVMAESKEWGEVEEDDSDGEENAEGQRCRRASDAHMARERRLSSSAEVLHSQLAALQATIEAGERDVQVVAESKEWGEVEDDSEDDHDGEDDAEAQRRRRASNAHMTRERRLSSSAEALHMQLAPLQASPVVGGRDVQVVAESEEWGEASDDSDGDDDAEALRCRRASDAHMARERRLSSSAEALQVLLAALQANPAISGRDVQVVEESKEWGEHEDDSDGDGNAEVQRCRRASDAHIARERRLSCGAEALLKLPTQSARSFTGEQDVHVTAESKEWGELEEDSDDEEFDVKLSRRRSDAHMARERRLSVRAEAMLQTRVQGAQER